MSDHDDKSRRWFMKTGALTSGAIALGLTGSAAAQNQDGDGAEEGNDGEGGGGEEFRKAVMFSDEFHAGSVFRIQSPALEDPPLVEKALEDYTARVIEFFNTNEDAYFFVPDSQDVQQGDLYVFDQRFVPRPLDEEDVYGEFVKIQYRPLGQEDFPFDLEEEDAFDITVDEGGGEGAVRPANFHTGALFRITSEPQGWVPEDVDDSGFFTDYDTHNAEYLGTNEQFLFFPQESASVEVGRLYVMWDEFEVFTPEGNLVATEFDVVNEDSIDVDEEFL